MKTKEAFESMRETFSKMREPTADPATPAISTAQAVENEKIEEESNSAILTAGEEKATFEEMRKSLARMGDQESDPPENSGDTRNDNPSRKGG